MADTPKHSVSVAGIVVDDHERVLVIKRRDNGHWEPPGGVLELNESFEAGTRREILEETGIDVIVGPLTGVYKNMSKGVVALVFRCLPNAGVATVSDEATSVAWRPVNDVLREMTPAYAIRITDALQNQTRVRTHDGTSVIADAANASS